MRDSLYLQNTCLTSAVPDKNGDPDDTLRWPRFPTEMLQQMHWSASESLGRIKILITEGYKNEHPPAFIRLKNIVCFSFQHAPQRKFPAAECWHVS